MSKKKPRANGAAPAAAAGANAPTSELPTADINAALQQRYRALAADVLALPAALERTLWLHNAALLLVQHALLYDEYVTREQALLLLWTALWLGRAHLATCGSEPLAILRREREKSVLWRIALAAGGAALQLAFLRVSGEPRRRAEHLLTLLPVYLLDAAAVVLLHLADAQLTWPQVALAAVEAPFLTSVFSVLYSHRKFLVYDRVAFALTAVSCFVHTAALLSAKVVARSTAPRDASTQQSQQRGRELVAELRRAIELEDEEERVSETTKQKKKKKGAKSSSQQSSDAPGGSSELESTVTTSASPPISASLLQYASVRVAALVAVQTLLLLTQVALSALFLLSWEITSVLMLSSAHVLYTLVQLHQTLAAPPAAKELALS